MTNAMCTPMLNGLILAAVVLVAADPASAQLLPEQRFVFPKATDALAVFDTDADGDQDLLRSSNGRLVIHEQFAPQQFRMSTDLGVGRTYDIRTGDLDGDGIIDIVSADVDNSRIRWAQGLGGGDFLQLQDLVTGTPSPYDLHLVDLDGDGDLDVLHADVGGGRHIRWNANLGGGSFGPTQTVISWTTVISTSVFSNQVAVGDVDQDGDQDLLVCQPTLAWLSNDGSGSFTSMPLVGGSALSDPLLTDLDGDADLDIVLVTTDNACQLVGFTNQGAGTFGVLQTLAGVSPNPGSMLVGLQDPDLNGDGDGDPLGWVFYGPGTGRGTVAFANNGNGTLSYLTLPMFFADAFNALGCGDLDGDGLEDIVTSDNVGLKVQYSNNGSVQLLTSANAPTRVLPLDVDGDLDQDVLLLSPELWGPLAEGSGPLQVALHRNLGNGVMLDAAEEVWVSGSAIYEAAVGDLDNDGDDDALMQWSQLWSGTNKKLVTFMANGGELDSTEHVGQPIFWTPNYGSAQPWLRDLDQDGDLDAMQCGGAYGIWSALNTGNGSFGPEQVCATGNTMWATLCDTDVDGDADIVWTGWQLDSLFWCANDGAGNFSPAQFLVVPPLGFYLETDEQGVVLQGMDMNSDGQEDLVIFNGDSIAFMLNTNGTFITGQVFQANALAYAIGDIDNSGTPEAVAIRANREVVTWLNAGLGIFQPELLLANATQNTGKDHIALADMDNDGLTDVITCSKQGSAAWKRNGGNFGTAALEASPPVTRMNVFPVPAREQVHIVCDRPLATSSIVHLSDVQGRLIRTLPGNGTNTILLDCGELAAGVYMLRITQESTAIGAARFVVE